MERDEDNIRRWDEVGNLLSELYRIVGCLEHLFPGRKFTPDGHLVGSIGEAIATHLFNLTPLKNSAAAHDAVSVDGRKVQVKFTQGNRGVALRAQPDYLVVLRLKPDRSIEIVYNGRGCAPWDRCGPPQSNGQRSISLSALRDISAQDPLDLYGSLDLVAEKIKNTI